MKEAHDKENVHIKNKIKKFFLLNDDNNLRKAKGWQTYKAYNRNSL